MRKKRWNVSELYLIRFMDHSTCSDKPIIFDIVGYLVENKSKYIVLSNWKATEDWLSHIEKDVIVKSTIISIENLSVSSRCSCTSS